MYCWGNTINGELGLGGIEENYILSPEEIVNFESVNNIKSGNYHVWDISYNPNISFTYSLLVACGNNHTLVVTDDGQLYACGSNDFGQLGHDGCRTKLRMCIYKMCT